MPSFVPMLGRLTHGAFPLPQVRESAYHPQGSTVCCCSWAWRADDLHVGMLRSRDPSARFELPVFRVMRRVLMDVVLRLNACPIAAVALPAAFNSRSR